MTNSEELKRLINTTGIKIKILDSNHSEQVQKILFSLGCYWVATVGLTGVPITTPRYTTQAYLFARSDRITHSNDKSSYDRESEMVEVELVAALTVAPKKVTIDGIDYSLDDVKNVLAMYGVRPMS